MAAGSLRQGGPTRLQPSEDRGKRYRLDMEPARAAGGCDDRQKSNHHVSQRCSDVLQADGGVMTREKRLRGSWISANVSGYSPSQTLSAARSRACEGTI
jgi:hypothetical protein